MPKWAGWRLFCLKSRHESAPRNIPRRPALSESDEGLQGQIRCIQHPAPYLRIRSAFVFLQLGRESNVSAKARAALQSLWKTNCDRAVLQESHALLGDRVGRRNAIFGRHMRQVSDRVRLCCTLVQAVWSVAPPTQKDCCIQTTKSAMPHERVAFCVA